MTRIAQDVKIEIRPIPNRNGIKEFSENLEYFAQGHIIAPFVNPETRKYNTGLSKEDKEFLKSEDFPYDISENYVKGVPHIFWESSAVKTDLQNNPQFLYPGKNLLDFVKYKYLLVNHLIYSSEAQMLEGSKPQATHYIYDEGAETVIKASKLSERNNLIKEVSKLSLARKRDLILILLNENTDNKDEDYLIVRFEDVINDKTKALELKLLLEGDSDSISAKALVKSAIQKNVLKRTGKGIFYFESNLGFNEQDVVDKLNEDEYQDVLLSIKEKIK